MENFKILLQSIKELFIKLLSPKLYRKTLYVIVTLIIAILLELIVCNFSSFHLVGKEYTEKQLDFSSAKIENGTLQDGKIISESGNQLMLSFENLETPVETFFFDITFENMAYIEAGADISDDTHKEAFRHGMLSAKVINGNQKSRFAAVNYSGNLHKLKLYFTPQGNGIFVLNSITVNAPIPFEFSFVRFLLIYFIFIAAFLIKSGRFKGFSTPFRENRKGISSAAILLTVIFILLGLIPINLARGNTTFQNEFTAKSGNQISQEIVDMFKQGKVELDYTPSEKLKSLENPYDWSARQASDAEHKWDHVYYNGKYYSYYGIGPVLTLFLPYNLITGYYFPTTWAVFIFGAIGMFFLTKTVLAVFRRFFPRIPASFVLLSIIILQASSCVWFNYMTPQFYEIAQSSGFCFTALGSFFLISSGVGFVKSPKLWRLCLSSAFFGMAVLCRPTLAVYCFCALLFIFFGAVKILKLQEEKRTKLILAAKFFAAALLPLAVFGGIQGFYNYARFGSFSEFGINYSLTINDFTRAELHTSLVAIGFFNYLFAFPIINEVFPFFHSNFRYLDPNGYYFTANQNAIGLFFRALPMFAYFGAFRAIKLTPKSRRFKNFILIAAPCIVAPCFIIFSIWVSGYSMRYANDFAWQMLLGALIICFTVYQSIRSQQAKSILRKIFFISCVLCVIVNFSVVYEAQLSAVRNNPDALSSFMSFERFFMFWK